MTNEWTQSLVVTLNGRLKTEDDYFIRTIFSTQDLFVDFSRVKKETFHLSDIFFVKIWWALAVDKWCYEMLWNSFKGRCEKKQWNAPQEVWHSAVQGSPLILPPYCSALGRHSSTSLWRRRICPTAAFVFCFSLAFLLRILVFSSFSHDEDEDKR